MAIRPTIPIVVRASDEFYTTELAPLQGTVTKIARPGMAEGYKVDTPLGSQPVTAQGVNFEQNRNDQWVEWVSFGSNANGGDAHIVETNSGGDIDVVGVSCIDIQVAPNAGIDGIDVTATGGSKGLEVTRDATSTDYGVSVTSAGGAAFPNFHSDSVSSVGMEIAHGSATGLDIAATPDGGAIGPSIHMASSTVSPTNDNVGTLWNQEQNSIKNLKAGMGSSAGYIVITKNSPCYARSTSIAFALDGSVVDQAIGGTFTFNTDQLPQNASEVMVTIWGRVSLSAFQDNTVVLRVRDVTAGDDVICEQFIYTQEHSGATLTTIRQSATIAQVYTLPAAGGRTFDLVWTGTTTGIPGSFTGFVEIQELRG